MNTNPQMPVKAFFDRKRQYPQDVPPGVRFMYLRKKAGPPLVTVAKRLVGFQEDTRVLEFGWSALHPADRFCKFQGRAHAVRHLVDHPQQLLMPQDANSSRAVLEVLANPEFWAGYFAAKGQRGIPYWNNRVLTAARKHMADYDDCALDCRVVFEEEK
jgi:hypothetical protein